MLRAREEFKICCSSRDWMLLNLEDALQLIDDGAPPQPSIDDFAHLLNKCRKEGNETHAWRLHAHVLQNGLDSHTSLGNYLVPMLAEAGTVDDARQVFHRLQYPNECSWSALISGYIKSGKPISAFKLYQSLRSGENVCPTRSTFVALLKACTELKEARMGLEIHADVSRLGLLEKDSFLGSALVDMYAKCSLLSRAYGEFNKLPMRDVVLWTLLITSYTDHAHGKEALLCFEQMQQEGISPDIVTFVCALKACGIIQNTDKGWELHAQLESLGLLERDVLAGTTIVDMYAKCSCPSKAQEVFDRILSRDVVSWNALIAGYVDYGDGEEAANCFQYMQFEGVSPDDVTFMCTLKACGINGATELGQEVHAEIERKGLEGDPIIGNALVDMYAKCGSLLIAQELFDQLLFQDVVSWTSLIGGYAEHGHGEEALWCFEQMQDRGIPPNAATYICVLKACGNLSSIDKARELHIEIERKGLLEGDVVIGNAVVGMYAKCGMLSLAQQVFDKLPVQDVVTWTVLIGGYIEHGRSEEALKCCEKMQLDGISFNAHTYVCSLKTCGSLGATDKGREVHAEIRRAGGLEENVVIGNTLVDMYSKCGSLDLAQQAFENLHVKDVISWTTLISGYAEHGHGEEAFKRFEEMQQQGISPNAATFVSGLKACGSIGAIDKITGIHARIEREGLLKREPVLGNTLVDTYAKCGRLFSAQQVLEELDDQDVVSWTAMIGGYAEHGLGEEALACYEQMQRNGIAPNAVTYVCSLKACSSTGATDKGREIHTEIERNGLLETDLVVGNTLVEMYAQWGAVVLAQHVFDKLPSRDVVSCNSLISGYAQIGNSGCALLIYDRMLGEGIKPDPVTFIVVLNACSRAGLFEKSQMFYEAMIKDFGISPTLQHHAGIVDLLCRVGELDKAITTIKKMPVSPDLVVWNTVLGACRRCGNVQVATQAFKNSVHLAKQEVVAYVLLSHTYLDNMDVDIEYGAEGL